MKPKVILSTFGPLHLLKSATCLSTYVDMEVIQGWIPTWWNHWFLRVASKIVGRDLAKGFERRTPACLTGKNHSVALAEFYLWACKLFKLQSPLRSSYQAAKIYGWFSRRYIEGADIFHVRSGSGFGGAIAKAKAQGMKVLVDHSIAHPAFMDRQLREEYLKNGALFNLGLDNPFWQGIVEECREGDALLVNSEFVKQTFVEQGFDAEKIHVAMLGVREDFGSLKQDYALKNGVLKILFTGSFGFRKGGEYLLLALKELEQQGIGYEMTCVGDASDAREMIARLNPAHLTLVNTVPQDDLKRYLAESDLYLFPSLCEGCASSGMEAMAAGLPVIATRESGLPIEHGEDGWLVPSKEVQPIVEALKQLAANQSLRARIGQKAAKKIAENYTWEGYAQRVNDLYRQLLK